MQEATILNKGIIRSGKPEDAETLAQHIYLAGKSNAKVSIYELLFPGGMQVTLGCLKRLILAETQSFFHYSHSIIYQLGDKVVSSGCMYDEDWSGSAKVIEACLEIGFSPEDLMAAYERAAAFYRVVPVHPGGVFVVEHGATSEPHRGQQMLSQMMPIALDWGRKLGYKKTELGMFMGHETALKIYEAWGFEVIEQKTDPEFEEIFGVPGMMRLVRDL